MKIEKLIELQEELQERKTSVAQLEGEQNAILKQLKEEYGCDSIKKAEKLIEKEEQEIEQLEETIRAGLAELEQQLKEME